MKENSKIEETPQVTELGVSNSTFFTPIEIEHFKRSSLKFPFIVYDGISVDNVIEVSEVVSISGMADNNGTPTEMTIYKHVKGKETERLVYRLVK